MQLTSPMDDVLDALAAQNHEIDGMLSRLDDDGWTRASRCTDWTVADVVLHLAQTNEMATASAEGRFDDVTAAFGQAADVVPPGATINDLAGLAVAAERGRPPKEVHERWRASVEAQAAAFAVCEPGARLRFVAGELAAVTLVTTRLAETWIHAGDIADGVGRELTPGPHLKPIVRLAWRTLPYAFSRAGQSMAGPVALALTAPDGAKWEFRPSDPAVTTVTGPALDFCLVAARRVGAAETALSAEGPDAAAVLDLVRTFA